MLLLSISASTWHSFPKAWDRSQFLKSLGVNSNDLKTAKPNVNSIKEPSGLESSNDEIIHKEQQRSLMESTGQPLWKSEDSVPVERIQIRSSVGETKVDVKQLKSSGNQLAEKVHKEAKENQRVRELVDIISALCAQQRETETSLEEIVTVMGEIDRKWRIQQKEIEKERRREKRKFQKTLNRRDVDIIKIREELKRERSLREMAEDKARRAEETAHAGILSS